MGASITCTAEYGKRLRDAAMTRRECGIADDYVGFGRSNCEAAISCMIVVVMTWLARR